MSTSRKPFFQMKPSFLVGLLLLSSFLYEAQGIRPSTGSLSAEHQQDNTQIKRSGNGAGEAILCKDEHCSGMHRKLVTKTTFNTKATTTGKHDKKDGNNADLVTSISEGLGLKEENLSVNPSPESEHREAAPEPYPDILDIAGMDYSPARKKPPIHN